MADRSRVILPMNGQQVAEGLGFPLTVMVNPGTASRLARYDEGVAGIGEILFSDRLNFVFTPGRLAVAMGLDMNEMLGMMIEQMNEYFSFDATEIPGELLVDLIPGWSAADTSRILGGNSSIRLRFSTLRTLSLESLFEMYEERNYLGISMEMLRFTFQLQLRFILSHLSRGGCTNMPYLETSDGIEKACPLPFKNRSGDLKRLHEYASWVAVEKQIFGKRYKDHMPLHLKNLRGLLCYSFIRDIGPTITNHPGLVGKPPTRACAFMAFIYGLHVCRFRSRSISADHLLLNDFGAIYYTAVMYMERFGFETSNLFSNHSFKKVLDELGKDYAVSVFDQTRCALFNAEGDDYENPLPRNGFRRGEMSQEIMDRYWEKRICIFLDTQKNHYIPIFDINLFFSAPAFRIHCPFCNTIIEPRRLSVHQCRLFDCIKCQQKFPSLELLEEHKNERDDQKIPCYDCRRDFPTRSCYSYHLAACGGILYDECYSCKKTFRLDKPHQCPEGKCVFCGKADRQYAVEMSEVGPYDILHPDCFFKRKPLRIKPPSDTWIFDFECLLEKGTYSVLNSFSNANGGNRDPKEIIVYRHRVNYAYAQPLYLEGKHVPLEEAREKAIEAYSIQEFWEKMKKVKECGFSVWYAHNLKGYDGRLLMDFFEENNIVPLTMVKAGDKIMCYTVTDGNSQLKRRFGGGRNRRFNPGTLIFSFKDTLLQLQTSLKNLPNMFGLAVSIRKGDFPYIFNTPENQDYDGPIPDLSFYQAERKRGLEREKFLEWHQAETARLEKEGRTWNLQNELKAYCINDVEVLSIAFKTYCDTMSNMNRGMSPAKTLTAAGYAYSLYMTMHLPPQTLCRLNFDQDRFARKAMHGGKTDVRIMQVELSPETIRNGIGMRYVDVQSLYPTVQYYDYLPIGSPKTHFYPDGDIPQDHFQYLLEMHESERVYFIECDLIPTRYVHHPVVGDFIDKKFVFHLYPLKRVILTSIEFKEAVAQGYAVTAVYRVDVYHSSCDLFKSYVQTFLRLKILSSKKPFSEEAPESEKRIYFNQIEEKYGFRIKEEEFDENPAIRSLAKLLLNSLWGKFGENQNRSEIAFLENAKDKMIYSRWLSKGKFRQMSERGYGSTALQVLFKNLRKRDYIERYVAVACFVTAHARMRLLTGLKTVGDRAVYHDTDSVIYVRQPGKPDIEEGCFLGDWESETGDQLIDSFIGLAPKTYAYSYLDPRGERKTSVKVKGFPMDGITEQKLTIDHFRHVLYTTIVPEEPSYRLDTLPTERRMSVTSDVNDKGVISVPVNVFSHVYPNKHNLYERIEEMEKEGAINQEEATEMIKKASVPFMFTTTQEKLLKVDYTKGVINKVDITSRFGLSSETNRIRFETLPHGWNEHYLNDTEEGQRPFEGFNLEQVEQMKQARKETYGEGWEDLQQSLEEREALADVVDV